MGPTIAVNQIINRYYDLYRENEITFTKDIIRYLKIDLRQIYVKCAGAQWPCIINSTSFQMAKIIIGTAGGAFQQITKKDAPPVNIRYCFIEDDGHPIYFFVACHVTEVTPYMNSKDLAVVTLTFTQRPPDDLILKLGTLLDAKSGFVNRKTERIVLNDASKRLLGLSKKESIIFVQNVPRRCILWDLSFSGAKIVIMGLANFLKGKDCMLRFMFSDPDEVVDVKGTIVKVDPIEGRRDIVSAGINFDENQVPLSYKIRINDYLSTNKKTFLEASSILQAKREAEEKEKAAAENAVKPVSSGTPQVPSQKNPSAANAAETQKPAAEPSVPNGQPFEKLPVSSPEPSVQQEQSAGSSNASNV